MLAARFLSSVERFVIVSFHAGTNPAANFVFGLPCASTTKGHMMKNSKQIRDEIRALHDRVMAIVKVAEEEGRDLSQEEVVEVDAINGTDDKPGQIDALTNQLKRVEKIEAKEKEMAAVKAIATKEEIENPSVKSLKLPARAKPACKLKNYTDDAQAYADGQFYLSILARKDNPELANKARKWCREHGVVKNTMTTGDNTKGGAAVPEALESQIIVLREKFGLFRQYANQVTMSDAVMIIPKLLTEITAYFVGEGDPDNTRNAITTSDIALGQIKLEARKLATLTPVSSELTEDAVVSIADTLTGSIAYQFARTEDNCGFNGDGTSQYGMIVGLAGALAAGSIVTAATGQTTFGSLTLPTFESVIGRRKMWGNDPAWYISQVGWANSMQRLMDASGGNTVFTISQGAPEIRFLGYPVRISQVLNSATSATTSQIACYFGDLNNGVYMGSRRGLNLVVDSSFYLPYDALAVRATERFDINVHDRGDASNAGGIVALQFAAS